MMRELVACAVMAAGISTANASFTDDFGYAADAQLPGTYVVKGAQTGDARMRLNGSALELTANMASAAGVQQGFVPSVKIDGGSVGATWKITAVLSANWYGTNELSGAYPSAGLVVYTGASALEQGLRVQVKHEASSDKDYLEIGYGSDKGIHSGWSGGAATTGATPYTLRIEKLVNGNIQIGWGSATAVTLSGASTGESKSAYDLLNSMATAPSGVYVGMYVNGQDYTSATKNTDGLRVTASFDSLTMENLNAVPEAASLGVLGAGVLALLGRRGKKRQG